RVLTFGRRVDDLLATVHRVAAGEDARVARAAGRRIGDEAARVVDRDAGELTSERGELRLSDRDDDEVPAQRGELGVRRLAVLRAPEAQLLDRPGHGAAVGADGILVARARAHDLFHERVRHHDYAFLARLLPLVAITRHLRLAAAVDELDVVHAELRELA